MCTILYTVFLELASCPNLLYGIFVSLFLIQVLYVSLHRHEYGNFYPGTGAAHEVTLIDTFAILEYYSDCIFEYGI